jgi:hypothetical protein
MAIARRIDHCSPGVNPSHCLLPSLPFASDLHMIYHSSTNGIYVTGLAHAYPQHSFGPKEFEGYVTRLYSDYNKSPGYIRTRKVEVYSC